jgi:hypothetical protein
MVSRRRYRLRLVSRELDAQPRHRVCWVIDGKHHALEVWTEAEWAALSAWERPESVAFLPGVGYLELTIAAERIAREIDEERTAAIEAWEMVRGLTEARW